MELNIKDGGGANVLSIRIVGNEDCEGWLQAACDFKYQNFKARFNFSSILNDFISFHEQLQKLNQTLNGQAVYSNIEGNVELAFTTDGLGHIYLKGELSHPFNPYLKISFEIDTDQTFLPRLIIECNEIIKQSKIQ